MQLWWHTPQVTNPKPFPLPASMSQGVHMRAEENFWCHGVRDQESRQLTWLSVLSSLPDSRSFSLHHKKLRFLDWVNLIDQAPMGSPGTWWQNGQAFYSMWEHPTHRLLLKMYVRNSAASRPFRRTWPCDPFPSITIFNTLTSQSLSTLHFLQAILPSHLPQGSSLSQFIFFIY